MTDEKELRRCSDCRCTMLLEMYFSKNRKGDYFKTCDGCRTKRAKYRKSPEYKDKRKLYDEKRRDNPEVKARVRENSSRHYQENKKEIREKHAIWKAENREKVKELQSAWYQNNKEKVRDRHKEWYDNNKERMYYLTKEWRANNRDRINSSIRDKRATDPYFKILCNLRNRVCKCIRRLDKSARTMDLLGCTVDELKEHLENKFEEGMTFDNYGEWHIDHIKPCVSFDLTDPEEQRTCFNYSNLQPLWARDNLSKGGKIDWVKNK